MLSRILRINRLVDQLIGSQHVNSGLDGPCHWASVRVHGVHALDGFPLGFRRLQLVMRVDAPDDQDVPIQLNLAGDF